MSKDERLHDTELCIDIDTLHHFLAMDMHDTEDPSQINNELIMVIFILCLLGVMLFTVSVAHYIIEKPKKKRMLRVLMEYVQRKRNNNHGNNATAAATNNSMNQNSASGSHNSLSKAGGGSGPAITVTDFSNSSRNLTHNSSYASNKSEDGKESEPLLFNATQAESYSSSSSGNNSTFPVPSRVRFQVGETIIEESSSDSQIQLNIDANNESDSALVPNTTGTEEEAANKSGEAEPNEECLKSISHLLDDKPWLTSPNSASQAAFGRKDSRLNMLNNPSND